MFLKRKGTCQVGYLLRGGKEEEEEEEEEEDKDGMGGCDGQQQRTAYSTYLDGDKLGSY